MTAQILQLRPVAKAPEGFNSTIHNGKPWFEAEPDAPLSVRKQMHADWRKAMLNVEFCKTYLELHQICERAKARGGCKQAVAIGNLNSFLSYGAPPDAKGIHHLELVEYFRFAVACAIRVPAPTQAEIKWKRRQLKGLRHNAHISMREAVRCINSDEHWHRENPSRNGKRWRKQ